MIPIRTSIRPRQTPYANYILIALNVVAFVFTWHPHVEIRQYTEVLVPVYSWAKPLMLKPVEWRFWQFLSYAFLHANVLHILGNMFFLFIFGNNVNDKLGHTKYVSFYLIGAVFSGVGHTLVNMDSAAPTLGASGAVAAITGAYLVLFPQTLVTVLYWFFFIGTIEIPALWFIGLKMIIIDNLLARSSGGVAYDAHVAGYIYGMGLTIFCLAFGWIPGGQFDLWTVLQQWNRRRRYRDAVAQGYDPFSGVSPSGRKQIRVREVKKTPEQVEKEARVQSLRQEVHHRLVQRDLSSAAQTYLELMAIEKDAILPRQALLDIANQLASEGRYRESAKAYEQFLSHYSTYEDIGRILLMVGLIYARYLNEPQKAGHYLAKAADRLTDPGQLDLCRTELARLESAE